MSSRLSSMLVQQGLLDVTDLQDAFTRQVVRGGALDTILLERGLVDEDVLLALLSKVAGLTPMTPDLLERIDAEVAAEVPKETAERLGICPISLSHGKLHVLLDDTSDHVALEELAYELGAKLHACASTEIRVLQGRQQLYGSKLPRRFAQLLGKLGERPPLAASLRGGATKAFSTEGASSLEPVKRSPSHAGFIPLQTLDDHMPEAGDEARPSEEDVAEEPSSTGSEISETPPPAETFVEDDTPIEPTARARDTPVEPDTCEDAPRDEDPAVQDPAVQDPAVQDPAVQDPAGADPAGPAPAEHDAAAAGAAEEAPPAQPPPAAHDPAEQDPAVQDPAVQDPAVQDPAVQDPAAQDPAVQHPAAEDPAGAAEEPAEFVSDDSAEEPAEIVSDEPAEEPAEIVSDSPLPSPPIDPATRRTTRFHATKPHETDQHPEILRDQPARGKRRSTERIAGLVKDEATEDGPTSVPAATELRLSAAAGLLTEDPPLGKPPPPEKPTATTDPHAPLPLDEALLAMTRATTRDEVLLAALRGARYSLPAVDLYVTQGAGQLRGRFASRGSSFDAGAVRQRLLRLDLPSVVARAAQDGAIYIGPAPDTDASATVLLEAEVLAPHLAIAPIQLRGKTVCLLIGHHPNAPVPSSVRGPLDRLVEGAASALVQLILRDKRARREAPAKPEGSEANASEANASEANASEANASEANASTAKRATTTAPTKPVTPFRPQPLEEPAPVRADESARDRDRPQHASGEMEMADSPSAFEARGADDAFSSDTEVRNVIVDFDTEIADRSVDELLGDLDGGQGNAADILAELRRRGRSGIDKILNRFPGELRFDRSKTRELPLVSECSTILRVLMHIGRAVIPGLAPLLAHGDDDVRFYATYLLSELTFPESVALLAERLHDSDPAVRHAAAYGLRRCKELSQYPEILQELREDLGHPQPRPRRAAMEALAALGDVVATPSLIAQLRDEEQEVAEAARRALVLLTKQDCGTGPSAWRSWWDQNRQRHRIEWLIDGLIHENNDICESAWFELKELTGVGFGYDRDLSLDQRQEIRRRYMLWWADKGLLDFGRFG